MGKPIALLDLTLSDLERSTLRSLIFQTLISWKGAELGHTLLLNINSKTIYKESNGTIIYDLEWPWKVKVKPTEGSMPYIS